MRHPDHTVCPDSRSASHVAPLPGHGERDRSEGISASPQFAAMGVWMPGGQRVSERGLVVLMTTLVWSLAALIAEALRLAQI